MAGWAGFTDEDLRKMRQNSPDRGKSMTGNKRMSLQNKKPKLPHREKIIREIPEQNNLHPNQRLSRARTPEIDRSKTQETELKTEKKSDQKSLGSNDTNQPADIKISETKNPESRELDDEEAKNVELTNMEKFQKQQKMIEEANKQKKALLAKTLNERRLRAKAESAKLTKIQKELNHLDSLLTADVSVIRDKIELASIEFLDAQKRYEKAEKEVISSKMNLFEKGETKERLTEHLYTIIHQNEVRKAKKLAELMEILEMETSAEEMELQAPSIPTLTNFNSVHTITSPTRKLPHSDSKSENQPTDPMTHSKQTTNPEQITNPDTSVKTPEQISNPDTPVRTSEQISNPDTPVKTTEQISQTEQAESQIKTVQTELKAKGDNITPCVQPTENNNTKLPLTTTESQPESEVSK